MMILFRSIFFILMLILELGAFLSEEYIAALGGIIACLMLTISPGKIEVKTKINPWFFYLMGILIFLILSCLDMNF